MPILLTLPVNESIFQVQTLNAQPSRSLYKWSTSCSHYCALNIRKSSQSTNKSNDNRSKSTDVTVTALPQMRQYPVLPPHTSSTALSMAHTPCWLWMTTAMFSLNMTQCASVTSLIAFCKQFNKQDGKWGKYTLPHTQYKDVEMQYTPFIKTWFLSTTTEVHKLLHSCKTMSKREPQRTCTGNFVCKDWRYTPVNSVGAIHSIV